MSSANRRRLGSGNNSRKFYGRSALPSNNDFFQIPGGNRRPPFDSGVTNDSIFPRPGGGNMDSGFGDPFGGYIGRNGNGLFSSGDGLISNSDIFGTPGGDWMQHSIRRSSNIGSRANLSDSPLILACETGNYASIISMLNDGMDPNIYDSKGNTPLHIATKSGSLKIVEALLDARADPNCQTERGETPLHFAAMNGHEKIVDSLIRSGADASIPDVAGELPMNYAEFRGFEHLAKYLLPKSISKKITEETLFELIDNDQLDQLSLALAAGISPNYYDGDEYPLHHALRNSKAKAAVLLIKAGANLELESRGSTPLHIAASKGQYNMVEILIKHGALVNERNTMNGNTPLHYAIKKENVNTVQILMAHKADLMIMNFANQNCLQMALFSNNKAIINAILSSGVLKQKNLQSYILELALQSNKVGVAFLLSLMLNKWDQTKRFTSNMSEDQARHLAKYDPVNCLNNIRTQCASKRDSVAWSLLDEM